MRLRTTAVLTLVAAGGSIVLATMALGLGGDDLEMTVASGGGGSASGGSYSLRSSIGQPDAGSLSSGGYTLRGGVLGAAGTALAVSPSPTASASPTASVTPGNIKRFAPFVSSDGVY